MLHPHRQSYDEAGWGRSFDRGTHGLSSVGGGRKNYFQRDKSLERKANGIKTNDVTAYCAGLVRQDPYLFTYNRGNVGKYLRERTSESPKKPAPKSEPKK